jgi:hypothetical protein
MLTKDYNTVAYILLIYFIYACYVLKNVLKWHAFTPATVHPCLPYESEMFTEIEFEANEETNKMKKGI